MINLNKKNLTYHEETLSHKMLTEDEFIAAMQDIKTPTSREQGIFFCEKLVRSVKNYVEHFYYVSTRNIFRETSNLMIKKELSKLIMKKLEILKEYLTSDQIQAIATDKVKVSPKLFNYCAQRVNDQNLIGLIYFHTDHYDKFDGVDDYIKFIEFSYRKITTMEELTSLEYLNLAKNTASWELFIYCLNFIETKYILSVLNRYHYAKSLFPTNSIKLKVEEAYFKRVKELQEELKPEQLQTIKKHFHIKKTIKKMEKLIKSRPHLIGSLAIAPAETGGEISISKNEGRLSIAPEEGLASLAERNG